MALRNVLIPRKPRSGCLEGRTVLIQFFHSLAGGKGGVSASIIVVDDEPMSPSCSASASAAKRARAPK
jgi:hypothetical protein